MVVNVIFLSIYRFLLYKLTRMDTSQLIFLNIFQNNFFSVFFFTSYAI